MTLAWMGWLGAQGVLGALDLRSGLQAVNRARGISSPTAVVEGQPLPDLRRAEQRFRRAHGRITGPAWAPVRLIPVVGRQYRSVAALSDAAGEASEVAIGVVTELQRLLGTDPPTGAERVSLIRAFGEFAARTEARLAPIRLGPREGLVPILARGRDDLATELAETRSELVRGSVGARAIADVLTGPRRYLLFAANNAEMRAGSGMFLSFGELVTAGGNLRLGEMKTVENEAVAPGAVPLDPELAQLWGWLKPNEEWRNLMLSPRFEVSARLAAQMWAAKGNAPVDGVLVVDPVAMQALLAATGPLTIEDRQISAETVLEELTHAQYLRFPSVVERREELGAIARAAFDALDQGRPSLTVLAQGLARAARGRHLMAWADRPEEQAAWEKVGVAGTVHADSLLLAVQNRGGTKLDRFLTVAADLRFEPSGNDTACTLTVVLMNMVPPGEPTYVTGPSPGSGVDRDVYLGILTAYLPGAARDAEIEGVTQLAVAGPDGPVRAIGFQLTVLPGEPRTVVVRFVLPGRAGSLTVEPTARVPGVQWSSGGAHWLDGEAHEVLWR